MAGEFNQLFEAIGSLRADVRNIARSIDNDRDTANERHRDNSGRLDSIEQKLGPLEETVKGIKPIVDQYQVTRLKLTGAVALGSSLLLGIGWVVIHIGGRLVDWILPNGH